MMVSILDQNSLHDIIRTRDQPESDPGTRSGGRSRSLDHVKRRARPCSCLLRKGRRDDDDIVEISRSEHLGNID